MVVLSSFYFGVNSSGLLSNIILLLWNTSQRMLDSSAVSLNKMRLKSLVRIGDKNSTWSTIVYLESMRFTVFISDTSVLAEGVISPVAALSQAVLESGVKTTKWKWTLRNRHLDHWSYQGLVVTLEVTLGVPPCLVFFLPPCHWSCPFLLPGRTSSLCVLLDLRRKVWREVWIPLSSETCLLSPSSIASDLHLFLLPFEF